MSCFQIGKANEHVKYGKIQRIMHQRAPLRVDKQDVVAQGWVLRPVTKEVFQVGALPSYDFGRGHLDHPPGNEMGDRGVKGTVGQRVRRNRKSRDERVHAYLRENRLW